MKIKHNIIILFIMFFFSIANWNAAWNDSVWDWDLLTPTKWNDTIINIWNNITKINTNEADITNLENYITPSWSLKLQLWETVNNISNDWTLSEASSISTTSAIKSYIDNNTSLTPWLTNWSKLYYNWWKVWIWTDDPSVQFEVVWDFRVSWWRWVFTWTDTAWHLYIWSDWDVSSETSYIVSWASSNRHLKLLTVNDWKETAWIDLVDKNSGTAKYIWFWTNQLERMRITKDWDVWIWFEDPKVELELNWDFSVWQKWNKSTEWRKILLEWVSSSDWESSSRLFFSEHNSTDAWADNYWLSLYYQWENSATMNSWFTPDTWNATWGLKRHNNSENWNYIFWGTRTSDDVTFNWVINSTNKWWLKISYDSDNAYFWLRNNWSDDNPIEIKTEDANDDWIILRTWGSDVATFNRDTTVLTSNLTINEWTDTIIDVISWNSWKSEISLHWTSQWTWRMYIWQDTNYWGWIEYNWDSSPVTTWAWSDYINLFRRNNWTEYWTARNRYNSNTWEFRESVQVWTRLTIWTWINHNSSSSYDKIRVWNSSNYTIWMASSQSFWALNDYAMTFTMNNDSDRGFLWRDIDDTSSMGAMSLTTNWRLNTSRSLAVWNNITPTWNMTNNSIVIWDSDTWFRQNWDWVLQSFANNQVQMQIKTSWTEIYDNLIVYWTVTADDYIYSSDKRLKKDIVKLNNNSILEKITKLNWYSYLWKNNNLNKNDKKTYWVIAQEVNEIFPELVAKKEDWFLWVKYWNFVAVFVESIKELYFKQIKLEKENIELKNKIEKIENDNKKILEKIEVLTNLINK